MTALLEEGRRDRDLIVASLLADAWHEALAPEFGSVTHCIEAAKIARAALSRLSVEARPLPCAIAVMNDEAKTLIEAGRPVSEWPKTAWSIGVDPDSDHPGPGWNGHMLLVGDGWIGDYSGAQFSRPTIPMRAWVSPTPPGWNCRDRATFAHRDGGVWAVVEPRPELASWRNGSAWRQPAPADWLDRLLHQICVPQNPTNERPPQ